MSPRVTRCPRCQTAFRVTAVQLQIASGAVRCGSCLQIFNAADHWVEDEPDDVRAALATRAEANQPEAVEDELRFDDDTELFADEYEDEDEDHTGPEPGRDSPPSRYSESFLDLEDWEEDPDSIFGDFEELEADPAGGDSDEEWAQQLLDDLEAEEAPEQTEPPASRPQRRETVPDKETPETETPEVAPPRTKAQPPASALADEFTPTLNKPWHDSAAKTGDEALVPLHARTRSGEERPSLLDLEPEPLHLSRGAPPRRRRKRTLLYALLISLALITLGGQYLYYNFERLAQGPQRPHLERVCQWLDCRLPSRTAPELIRTGSLMVRSHPEQAGALVVDAIITNQAPFAQPYPHLQLVFSDMEGATVAARTFEPEEYLAGELTGSRRMPSRRPIHIALELVDPGPEAVNYELHLGPGQDHSKP